MLRGAEEGAKETRSFEVSLKTKKVIYVRGEVSGVFVEIGRTRIRRNNELITLSPSRTGYSRGMTSSQSLRGVTQVLDSPLFEVGSDERYVSGFRKKNVRK